ncbi:MAG: hypothetical protein LUF78_13410 [Clostridiales bacterium]|nr:hypothetical protein [Clostridiales bacterium]
MSGYILCQTKRAEKPYYIQNIRTNIYSMEELCYYLRGNLYLVDDTIMNEELCAWLEEELELKSLAAKLRPAIGRFTNMEDLLYPVFKEINYLTYEEMRALNGEILRMKGESPPVIGKHRGDSLMENGMLVDAIHVYEGLLEEETARAPGELTERIWHNLGCAYSYLFQMEKAQDCFYQAYQVRESQEELTAYLLSYCTVRTPIEFESRMNELRVSEETRILVREKREKFDREPEREVYARDVDDLLERFTGEYHRSTGA